MLSVVGTPIGNLGDITFRAIEILKKCDYVVSEDTRHTKILLNKYDIKTRLLSYHSHSSGAKVHKILDLLENDHHLALVTDAGTPGISDPGYKIVSEAIKMGIKVEPIPGPSAFLTALQASGAPINTFIYLGFFPTKKGRKTLLEKLQNEERTMVFYESPYRILKTLNDLKNTFGEERILIIARELTKIHEEFRHDSIKNLINHFETVKPRGEFVIIIPAQ